jgi:PAS domain S-box-containing protein
MFACEWNVQSDLIVRSDQAIEILKDPNALRTTGRSRMNPIHPEDVDKARAAVAGLTQENPSYRMEIRELRGDGETNWLQSTGSGFFDDHGNLIKVVGMAVDVTDRKRDEDIVRECEERSRRVFRGAGVGIVILSTEGHFMAANDSFCECVGYSEEELRKKTVESLTHGEDWPIVKEELQKLVQKGMPVRRIGTRWIRKDGTLVHTEISATLIYDANGCPQCIVGEVLDVTERKKTEESLSILNRRLIEAQEQERFRIARELHDDITQRMALVTVELEEMVRRAPTSSPQFRRGMQKIRNELREIASDVQLISHRLHSSKLEHLGIVAAAKSICEETARQQRVQVIFSHDKMPSKIPFEISLSLFRVLQESLHNAVKHSGTEKIKVKLYSGKGEIGLTVADAGCGFDPRSPSSQRGIGLLGMRERLSLVQGRLEISSTPGRGTVVRARVALPEKVKKEELQTQTGN